MEAKQNKELNFFDIVKLIHPDLNPDVSDASLKMNEAIENKDDPKKLYILAVKWGFIQDDTVDLEDITVNYIIDAGKAVRIDQDKEGIVIDVLKRSDGKLEAIVFVDNTFKKFVKKDGYDQDINFLVTGYADDNRFMDLEYKYQLSRGNYIYGRKI